MILALTVLAYYPVLRGELLGDESLLILNNPQVRYPEGAGDFFREQFWPGKPGDIYYRPLVIMSYALNWKLGRENPLGYHLFNLFFHLGSVLLFYLIFRKSHPAAILTATSIFALHPVLTEAVSKISGRTDLMSVFFILLCWRLWQRLENRTASGKIVVYPGIFLCALLSMLCKEIGILIPLLLLANDWGQGLKGEKFIAAIRRRMFGYLSLAAALAAYLLLRTRALSGAGLAAEESFLAGSSVWQRPLMISRMVWEYARLELFPILLSPDYFYTHKFSFASYPLWPGALSLILGIGFLVLLIAKLRERNQFARLGLLWMIALLPVLHLIPIPPALAERFLYLPTAFFALGFSLLLLKATEAYPKTGAISRGAILTCFLTLTLFNNQSYQTRRGNFQNAITKVPEEKVFHNLLALDYMDHKYYPLAEKQLLWALNLDPYYPEALVNLGIVKYKTGDREAEMALYQQAIQAGPDFAAAHFNLGVAWIGLRKMDQAQLELEKAFQLDPLNPAAPFWLGRVALSLNQTSQAKRWFDASLRIADWYLPALKYRARIAISEEDFALANSLIQRAEKFSPRDPELVRLRDSLPR